MSQGPEFQKLISELDRLGVDPHQQPGWVWTQITDLQKLRRQRCDQLALLRRLRPWQETLRDE